MKTPLNFEQLNQLHAHFALNDFVRINEPKFKELNLSLVNKKQLLQAMANNPILMQRPIITWNNQAIIARHPELLLTYFT